MCIKCLFQAAEKEGCEQVLWVFGEDQEITEVGAMNIFILLRSETGEAELVTPPLSSGTVLPGDVYVFSQCGYI